MPEKSIKRKVASKKVFCENPYDIENIFESLSIASRGEKELLYVDRLIANIRLDPLGDITEINYKILKELELINIQNM